MGLRLRKDKRPVRVHVEWGMGGSVSGVFPRDELAGKPAGEVIHRVLARPQTTGTGERTARALERALRVSREIDAEVIRAKKRRSEGEPIALDEPLVSREGDTEEGESGLVQETEEIRIRLSESYRGGDAR